MTTDKVEGILFILTCLTLVNGVLLILLFLVVAKMSKQHDTNSVHIEQAVVEEVRKHTRTVRDLETKLEEILPSKKTRLSKRFLEE